MRVVAVRSVKEKTDFLAFSNPHTFEKIRAGRALLCYDDDENVVASCVVSLMGNQIGTIGSFKSINNQSAATHILSQATKELKSIGATRVIGPINGNTWHSYRLNTGPYEQESFLKEPTNPKYYPDLWLNAGFTVCEKYETRITTSRDAAISQAKFYKRSVKKGYTFSAITAENYNEALHVIYDLSMEIFKDNIFFTPINFEDFRELYLPAKAIVLDDLSWIAFGPDKKPAGFIFSYPDYIKAVESMRGDVGMRAKFRFVVNRRKAQRVCVKTLGVLPQTRGTGLSGALTWLTYSNAFKLGYKESLMCLMHEKNESRHFGGNGDNLYRSYHLYEAPLEEN